MMLLNNGNSRTGSRRQYSGTRHRRDAMSMVYYDAAVEVGTGPYRQRGNLEGGRGWMMLCTGKWRSGSLQSFDRAVTQGMAEMPMVPLTSNITQHIETH